MFLLRQKHILINLPNKKCFNGCRPPKKRRKKHNYNLLYKFLSLLRKASFLIETLLPFCNGR